MKKQGNVITALSETIPNTELETYFRQVQTAIESKEEKLAFDLLTTLLLSNLTVTSPMSTAQYARIIDIAIDFVQQFSHHPERISVLENGKSYYSIRQLLPHLKPPSLCWNAYWVLGNLYASQGASGYQCAQDYYSVGLKLVIAADQSAFLLHPSWQLTLKYLNHTPSFTVDWIKLFRQSKLQMTLRCMTPLLRLTPVTFRADDIHKRKTLFLQHNQQWQQLRLYVAGWHQPDLTLDVDAFYAALTPLFDTYQHNIEALLSLRILHPEDLTADIRLFWDAIQTTTKEWPASCQTTWVATCYQLVSRQISKVSELQNIGREAQHLYSQALEFEKTKIKVTEGKTEEKPKKKTEAETEEKILVPIEITPHTALWQNLANPLLAGLTADDRKQIIPAQRQYSQRVKEKIITLLEQVLIPLLGTPPPLQILIAGSLNREQLTLMSDLDCEILVSPDSDNLAADKDYAERLWQLFSYHLDLLDCGLHLENSTDKINTPPELFTSTFLKSGDTIAAIPALMGKPRARWNLQALYATPGGGTLFADYQNLLQAWLGIGQKQQHRDLAKAYLQQFSLDREIKHSPNDYYHAKEDLLQPLTLLISYWALYYAILTPDKTSLLTDSEAILTALQTKGVFTLATVFLLQTALQDLNCLRLHIQKNYQAGGWRDATIQPDQAYFPGKAAPMDGSIERKLLELTSKQVDSLQMLQTVILQPLFRSLSAWQHPRPATAWDLLQESELSAAQTRLVATYLATHQATAEEHRPLINQKSQPPKNLTKQKTSKISEFKKDQNGYYLDRIIDVMKQELKETIPPNFIDYYSRGIMWNPVQTRNGSTYDKSSLLVLMANGKMIEIINGGEVPIYLQELTEDTKKKEAIQNFLKKKCAGYKKEILRLENLLKESISFFPSHNIPKLNAMKKAVQYIEDFILNGHPKEFIENNTKLYLKNGAPDFAFSTCSIL